MAASSSTDPNFLQQVLADARLISAVNAVLEQTRQPITAQAPECVLEDEAQSYEHLATVLMLAVNGTMGLPDQKVTVEYLRSAQKLVIPYALGMSPVKDQIRALVVPTFNGANVRATIDAMPTVVGTEIFSDWLSPTFYIDGQDPNDPDEFEHGVFSAVSAALQFNCDVRDTGFLLRADACCSDGAWQDISRVDVSRVMSKLQPRTITHIAALNLPGVANEPLAAFVRAYGLSIGLLPDLDSACVKEYMFESRMPKPDALTAINNFHQSYERPIMTPCLQILSMFGLMHLAKDHTFRTGDAAMTRIGTSYIMTLRTDMSAQMLDRIKSNMEPYIRTAPHPFGLGQTYWLARVLARHGKLVSPLAVRINASPPPVQRLMIADAARKEWLGLPIGRVVDTIFSHFYASMEVERLRVLASPPSYSSLHRLYGVAVQRTLDEEVVKNVQSMMPTIYGYVMATHRGERDEADGLALALSLKNVQRDQKGLVQLWENAWVKYSNTMEEAGMLEFVQHMQHGTAPPSSG